MLVMKSSPLVVYFTPKNKCRRPFFFVANHKNFERFISICIVLNTILMTLKWYGMPDNIKDIQENINSGFTAIFFFEFVFKFISYGFRYFKNRWNNFDFFIVLCSVISIFLYRFGIISLNTSAIAVRNLNLGRIFKILRGNKSLRVIFSTFLMSLTNLLQVGCLLVLFLFMYSILGVYLFAKVKRTGILNNHINFTDVTSALLTLVRASTGENWQ